MSNDQCREAFEAWACVDVSTSIMQEIYLRKLNNGHYEFPAMNRAWATGQKSWQACCNHLQQKPEQGVAEPVATNISQPDWSTFVPFQPPAPDADAVGGSYEVTCERCGEKYISNANHPCLIWRPIPKTTDADAKDAALIKTLRNALDWVEKNNFGGTDTLELMAEIKASIAAQPTTEGG